MTFKDLKPGNYKARLPNSGSQGGTVSMTTFVNGKLASRTDFPVGSPVGTFAVASAKDTITLKFESNTGSMPTDGVGAGKFKETDAGATFGGRLQTGDGSAPTNSTGATGGGR